MITTQKALRESFWDAHPGLEREARERRTFGKGQNAQLTDTRLAWCDYVDHMYRNGEISEALAYRATL